MPPFNKTPAHYYFALSRLVALLTGGSANRSEQSWSEAAVAGTLVHAITYLFAARLLLADRTTAQQFLLVLPVAFLVLAWWSVFFYACTFAIKASRALGFLRDHADRHLQSIFAGFATTLFASHLIASGSWMRLLGMLWIGAVALNLTAAAVLALLHAEPAR